MGRSGSGGGDGSRDAPLLNIVWILHTPTGTSSSSPRGHGTPKNATQSTRQTARKRITARSSPLRILMVTGTAGLRTATVAATSLVVTSCPSPYCGHLMPITLLWSPHAHHLTHLTHLTVDTTCPSPYLLPSLVAEGCMSLR